jgi:hypothetical protein
MKSKFALKAVITSLVGGLVAVSAGVHGRTKYRDPDQVPPERRQALGTRYSLGNTLGGDYTGLSVQLPYGVTKTSWIGDKLRSWIFGGERDFGKWLCNNCVVELSGVADLRKQISQLFTDVINKSVWGEDHLPGWRVGDFAEICNGTQCITAEYIGYVTDPWLPDPTKFRPDNRNGYKNPEGYNVDVRMAPVSQWRETTYRTVNPNNGRTVDIIVVDEMPTRSGSVTAGPLIIVPSSDSYPSGSGMTVYPCADEFDCPS